MCVDYESMVKSSDKICLTYEIKDRSERYRARKETEDDQEYEETNEKAGIYVVLILNENLEKLHRFKSHSMNSIGANDSFLFFTFDFEHEYGILSFYTWSMEFVKTIGQSNDPDLPFYFPLYITKFVNLFGRYCFIDEYLSELKLIDEETGILLKSIDADDFVLIII